MKKVLALVLALTMVLGMGSVALAEGNAQVFWYTMSDTYLASVRTALNAKLDEAGITLYAGDDVIPFLYADYNYENIEDTDCLPAVAQYLVQRLRGYYNITRTIYTVPKHNGRTVTEKTRQVFIRRHHEDTPFDPKPTQKQRLF